MHLRFDFSFKIQLLIGKSSIEAGMWLALAGFWQRKRNEQRELSSSPYMVALKNGLAIYLHALLLKPFSKVEFYIYVPTT